MLPVLWVALSGCLWSPRLHDYEVWVDGPGAVSVGVAGDDVSATPIPAGEGDLTGTFVSQGRTVELTRQDAGIRARCDACGPMQILVGADGRILGLYQRDEVSLRYGEPVRVERRYALDRASGEHSPFATLALSAEFDRLKRVEAMQRPLRGIGWTALSMGMFGVLPSLLLLGDERYIESAVLTGATVFLLGWGGNAALGKRRQVVLYEAGDTGMRPRRLKD